MHGAARRIERLQEPEPLRACMKTLHILSLAPAGASAVPDSEGVPPRRVSPSPQVGHLSEALPPWRHDRDVGNARMRRRCPIAVIRVRP